MPAFAPTQKAPSRPAAATHDAIVSAFSALGLALGSIFFIPRPWIGLVLWLALLRDPRHAAFAVLGLAIGAVMKRSLGISERPGPGGGVKANALLAAIVVGWMTGSLAIPLGQQVLLAGAAAALAALVAAAVTRLLSKSLVPALLWGYCLVAAMLFTVCPQCTVLSAKAMPAWPQPADALEWTTSFLRAIGSLMYSADPVAGLFVGLAILLWSRTMFICGVVAWASGALVALGFQQMHLVYDWRPLSYNYFLAGMAMGAALFLPGRASLLVAAATGAVAAFFGLVLQYALQWSAASYLPMSAAFAIWVGIGALTLAGEQSPIWRNTAHDSPPETSWWRLAFATARFGAYAPLLAVPVAGELVVAQGFSGSLSHRGIFRHGLDFQRPHSADARAGSIAGSAVTAPAPGIVERIRNSVADNAPGVCDYAEMWGNYVVIRLDAGGWALLGHLQQDSIVVAPGGRVETGAYLGRVGNSGRSSVPHLHMHVQESPDPGSPTRPFRLANFVYAAQRDGPLRAWRATAVPPQGQVLMAAAPNPAVQLALTGITPGSAVWSVESTGRVPRAFRPRRGRRQTRRIDVSLDSLGRHVFDAGKEGRLVARLDPDAWRAIELCDVTSPLLKLLALAAPCIPYAASTGMTWSDLPPAMPAGRLLRPVALMFAPYLPRPFRAMACGCACEPGPAGKPIEIVSQPQRPSAALPSKLSCQFAPYRGPVKLRAQYEHGSVTFSLLSYEPGAAGGRAPE